MNNISQYEKIPFEKHSFPVRILFQKARTGELVAHWHENIEMLFLTSGSCHMTCASNSFNPKKGDLVFINNSELHFYHNATDLRYMCVILNPKMFADTDSDNIYIQNFIQSDKYVEDVFSEMAKEFREKKDGYNVAIKGLTYKLMTYLLRNYQRNYEPSSVANEIMAKRINEIIEYISLHYADTLTSAELSKKWFLSESYFCRFFKKATGQPPTEYINRIRVDKAAVLLKKTNESITKISSKVGFDDVNYFSRTFKKFMNISPSEYKKSGAKKDE